MNQKIDLLIIDQKTKLVQNEQVINHFDTIVKYTLVVGGIIGLITICIVGYNLIQSSDGINQISQLTKELNMNQKDILNDQITSTKILKNLKDSSLDLALNQKKSLKGSLELNEAICDSNKKIYDCLDILQQSHSSQCKISNETLTCLTELPQSIVKSHNTISNDITNQLCDLTLKLDNLPLEVVHSFFKNSENYAVLSKLLLSATVADTNHLDATTIAAAGQIIESAAEAISTDVITTENASLLLEQLKELKKN